ncbi:MULTISPECIES: hypothetical protein [Chromobacterium]|uniref:Uncharacterized protein n=2 Tax=Chromobacterium TaxID=535 RepID=A0A1D9LCE0_9NEIS|nr:hypothetical protein [Chromobacterium vaccinii]AOZ48900.1 hypothetical protein BKX93_02070 [Chromobacterium vaccinii]
MSNLIQLFTPGHQNRSGRFHIALGEWAVVYGVTDSASVCFRRDGGGLSVECLARDRVPSRFAVLPDEHIQLTVCGKRLWLWVQAVTPTHVVVDAAEEPGADFALVVMPATA